jgi:hypothetical protein
MRFKARQRELIEDAERATETMRKLDPEAAPVRVPLAEWTRLVKLKAQLLEQIEDSMGQKAQHIGHVAAGHSAGVRRWMLGLDPDGKLKSEAQMVDQSTSGAKSIADAKAEFAVKEAQREEERKRAEAELEAFIEQSHNEFCVPRGRCVCDEPVGAWCWDEDDDAPTDVVPEPVQLVSVVSAPAPEPEPIPEAVEPEPEPEPERVRELVSAASLDHSCGD